MGKIMTHLKLLFGIIISWAPPKNYVAKMMRHFTVERL